MKVEADTSELDRLIRKAEELDGVTQDIAMADILTDDFMQAHTQFGSIQDFFNHSGLEFTDQASFEAIPATDLDVYVASVTDFDTWADMLGAAGGEFVKKQLGF